MDQNITNHMTEGQADTVMLSSMLFHSGSGAHADCPPPQEQDLPSFLADGTALPAPKRHRDSKAPMHCSVCYVQCIKLHMTCMMHTYI